MITYETHHFHRDHIEMHRHRGAYLSLIVRGAYLERSVDGLFALSEGQLVFHPEFHAHENEFPDDGAVVLNMALSPYSAFPNSYTVVLVHDSDGLANAFRGDPHEALAIIHTAIAAPRCDAVQKSDWVRVLARALASPHNRVHVRELASRFGIAPETASRSFRRTYGVGPAEFRREARLRLAIGELTRGESLTDAALNAGYADQSHMGREFRRCLGLTPANFKGQIRSREVLQD